VDGIIHEKLSSIEAKAIVELYQKANKVPYTLFTSKQKLKSKEKMVRITNNHFFICLKDVLLVCLF
jgi:hypothetical protein